MLYEVITLLRHLVVDHAVRAELDAVGVVAELYEPLAEEKQQRFTTNVQDAVHIDGDRDLLFQAVANLVDNAIRITSYNVCYTKLLRVYEAKLLDGPRGQHERIDIRQVV